jgi:putative DNA primase/helicase
MQRNLNQHNHGGVVTPSKPNKILGLPDTPKTKLPLAFSGKILGDLLASTEAPSESEVETILKAIEAISEAPIADPPNEVVLVRPKPEVESSPAAQWEPWRSADPISEALMQSKPISENIPAALKAIPRWVPWRYGPPRENGKKPKQPYNARTGKLCDVTTPINWSSFETALKVVDSYDGIGIVLNGDGLVGIDLDNCMPQGRLLPRTLRLMDSIPSYWETSSSGKGLRCFAYGSLPIDGKRKGSVEVYANKRFLTVTGRKFDTYTEITDCAKEIAAFYQKHFGNSDNGHAGGGGGASEYAGLPLPEPVSPKMANERILELARNAANGAKFKRLYDDGDPSGDPSGYPSGSEADAALTGMLAFYTQDPGQLVDLFSKSALVRDKFTDRPDYQDRTVCFVLRKMHAAGGPFYNPVRLLSEGFHDHGNARRLVRRYGDVLRYSHDFKKWLIWDGRRWAIDSTQQIQKFAKSTTVEFLAEAFHADNDAAKKFAVQSLNQARIRAMIESAQSELPVKPLELDQQPQLLNFQNGTVDLQTGELMPHDPEQFITKIVHHNYIPGAKAPRFLQFLREIGFDSMIDYLQKAFGYSLTGLTSQKAVFICHGQGDNGKTTLLNLFRSLLEEYATLLQINTLMRKTQEDNVTQADIADLRGARFVMTSETEEGQRLSEAKVKRITQGMGRIRACRKYENLIEFPESHKLWMDANHRPVVRGTDNAIWNRMHLIPFNVTIQADRKDPELGQKLLQEAEGILAWAVAGAVRWYKEGLQRPPEVQTAADDWRNDSDALKDFFEECCVFDPAKTTPVNSLWSTYQQWCFDNQEFQIDKKVFNDRIKSKGCQQDTVRIQKKPTKVWRGVEVSEPTPSETDFDFLR